MNNHYWEGKNGPLLIAEIGGNHEGNFEYAKKLTHLAIDSGCDYVKFQIYTGDGLVNPIEGEARNKHFKKFELTKSQHIKLAELCRDNNTGYLASVWDEPSLHWINPFLDFYKIGSGDLTAYPLIKKICEKKKPILLSTGLATEKEVVDSVNFIKSCDKFYESQDAICLLQCTSMYPILSKDANLRVIEKLHSLTGYPVGYSDHTEGSYALEIAVALGACVLEFHFTDSREGKKFRDHKVSLTNEEVKKLSSRIREIEALKGNRTKAPLKVEGDHITSFRRAIYSVHDLKAGEIVRDEDLVILRPNHGIDAREFDSIIGKIVKSDIKAFQKLDWSLFE